MNIKRIVFLTAILFFVALLQINAQDDAITWYNKENKTIYFFHSLLRFPSRGFIQDKSSKQFGFADKESTAKIIFKYDTLISQDENGFGEVKKKNFLYLIDSTGKEYKLASKVSEIDSSTLVFDVRKKSLFDIPVEIFEKQQILILWLDENNIKTLPKEIGSLYNLTHLSLVDNQINFLPEEIEKLTKLIELDLSLNSLNTLPPEIKNLKKLSVLSLYKNHLTTLPSEIGNLTNLIALDLGENNITSLPSEILNLNELLELNLGNHEDLIPDFTGSNPTKHTFTKDEKFSKLQQLIFNKPKISKEEKEKLTKFISHCKVYF